VFQRRNIRFSKTLLFEEKYGVNIIDFSTIGEIEKFIEKKEG
jgi:hypothetical protein